MTREQYEMQKAVNQRRAFLEAVRPFEKMKANVYASAVRPMFIYPPDGRIEHGEWPQWVQDAVSMLDEQIKMVAEQFAADGSGPQEKT